jgi:hypothetical protein
LSPCEQHDRRSRAHSETGPLKRVRVLL